MAPRVLIVSPTNKPHHKKRTACAVLFYFACHLKTIAQHELHQSRRRQGLSELAKLASVGRKRAVVECHSRDIEANIVEDVEYFPAEFNALRFLDLPCLGERHIGIKKSRPA